MIVNRISDKIEQLNIEFEEILDIKIIQAFNVLFQIIEEQNTEINDLRAKLDNALKEINRLKGEQGKPNCSSEADRKKRKKRKQRN